MTERFVEVHDATAPRGDPVITALSAVKVLQVMQVVVSSQLTSGQESTSERQPRLFAADLHLMSGVSLTTRSGS